MERTAPRRSPSGALILGAALAVVAFALVLRWAPPDRATSPDDSGESGAALTTDVERHCLESLAERCRRQAEQLTSRLGDGSRSVISPPFVLAGDLSEVELDRWRRGTIEPAAQAMANVYFKTPPSDVITVLLFSDKASYQRGAELLYGEPGLSIYGYYKPRRRVIVVNIATGGGSLVHELTHALAAFDFPAIPQWLNEGLASLHEECRFRQGDHGPWIEGLPNWRLPVLQEEIRRRRLPSTAELLRDSDEDFQRLAAVNYAHARYFCMFLQHRGVLSGVYRSFRAEQRRDPRGEQAVLEAFPGKSWAELDAEFQRWAVSMAPPAWEHAGGQAAAAAAAW